MLSGTLLQGCTTDAVLCWQRSVVVAGAKAGVENLAAPDAFAVCVAVHTCHLRVNVVAHVCGTRPESLNPSRDRAPEVQTVKLDASSMVSARERLPPAEVNAAVDSLLQALMEADQVAMRLTVRLGGRSSVLMVRSTHCP